MKYLYKRNIIITFFVFSILSPILAQSYITVKEDGSDKCVTLEIVESTSANYKAKIRIHKIKNTTKVVGSEEYQHLFFDEINALQNVGEPALPVIVQHIGLPLGSSYKAEIIEDKWTTIPVKKIYPAQVPLVSEGTKKPFEISEKIYNSEEYYFDLMKKSDIMKWKGIENVFITICPFKYYPAKQMLSVLSEFTLSVSFDSSAKKDNNQFSCEEESMKVFDNIGFLPKDVMYTHTRFLPPSYDFDYLIIVGNIPEIENSQAMNDFRKWKALKGYKTKMVSTSTIGSDSASIKNYISQQYLLGIRRVLFIGTQEKIPIPTFQAKQCQLDHPMVKSDYWYGCIDGDDDIQGDLPIARFVTNTLLDFQNVVDKTIKYESLYHEWANRVLLVSYQEYIPSFQSPLDSIYNTYHQTMAINKAFAASVANGGNGATILDVIDYINNGVNIATVNAHGNAGGFWLFDGPNSTLDYTNTGLLNSDTYPVFFSNACNNGDFTSNYSIINNFMRSDHCSSAWIGSSVPSFIIAQNLLTIILYSNMFNHNLWTLGDLLLQSHITNLGYGNTAIDNAFSSICGGDPTLEIWTGNQSVFEDVNISVSNNYLEITVPNINNFNVNISTENGELVGKYSSTGYSIYFPLSSGKYDLAICKHNYVPYVVHVDTGSHYIQNETITRNAYYGNTPISVGYDVTSSSSYGNVVIESNAKVNIGKGAGVTIKNGFECKSGGELVIK